MASITPISPDEGNDFDELDISELEDAPQKNGRVVRSNFDLGRYQRVFDSIPAGKQRKWRVPTGDIITAETARTKKEIGRGKLEYADDNGLRTASRLLGIGVHVQFLGHVTQGEYAGRSVLRVVPLEKRDVPPTEARLRNLRLRAGRLWDNGKRKVALAKEQPSSENDAIAKLAREEAIEAGADRAIFIQADRDANLIVTEVPTATATSLPFEDKHWEVNIKDGVEYSAKMSGLDEEGKPVYDVVQVKPAPAPAKAPAPAPAKNGAPQNRR